MCSSDLYGLHDLQFRAHCCNPLKEGVMCNQICSSQCEFNDFYANLKIAQCPHCKTVGYLIKHGFLRGYSSQHQLEKTVRATRVFCSNRNRAAGWPVKNPNPPRKQGNFGCPSLTFRVSIFTGGTLEKVFLTGQPTSGPTNPHPG